MAFYDYWETKDWIKFIGYIAVGGMWGCIIGDDIVEYMNESRIEKAQHQLNENIEKNHDVRNFQFKTLSFGKEEGEEKYFVKVIGQALKTTDDEYKYFSFKYPLSKENYEKMKKQFSSEIVVNDQNNIEPNMNYKDSVFGLKPAKYFEAITDMAKDQKAYEVKEIISVKDFEGLLDSVGIKDAFLTDASNIIENGNKAESALGFITADGQKIQRHIAVLSQDKNKINENADFFKEEGTKIEVHHEGKREQDLLWTTKEGYVNAKTLDQGLYL